MIKKDLLWKSIIKDLFPNFVKYFFKKYEPQVDWSKGFEFLDKELEKIYPESTQKDRRADLLAKVFLKNGNEHWILIHIEVQGYVDKEFPLRMYMYNYRSFDKLGKNMTALAILTDDEETYHPKYYEYKLWDTKLRYDFQTYKLLDKQLEDFKDTSNIFAIVMKMAWYGLKNNKLKSDEDLLKLKIALIKELFKHKIPKKRIGNILTFIENYVRFNTEKYKQNYIQQVEIFQKNYKPMSTTELVRHELKKIGIKESAFNLLNAGFSWNKIGDLLKLPIGDVEEFKEEYKDRLAIKSMLHEGKSHEEIEKALNVEDYLIHDVLEKMKEK